MNSLSLGKTNIVQRLYFTYWQSESLNEEMTYPWSVSSLDYFKILLMFINVILDFIMENNVSWVLILTLLDSLNFYRARTIIILQDTCAYLPHNDSVIQGPIGVRPAGLWLVG